MPNLVPSGGYTLTQPVLLRSYDTAATGRERNEILYPSHYFATVPEAVGFYAEVYGADGGEGLKLGGSIEPDAGGEAVSTAAFDVPPLENGSARVYGTVSTTGATAGIYVLKLELQDATGKKLADSSSKISISAISQWVETHWDDAIQLVSYEASKNERKVLEKAPEGERMAAWN